MRSLFVTGGSGFIGRHFLRRLDATRYGTVYCLTRDRARLAGVTAPLGHIQIIEADLGDVAAYASTLAQVDTVLHLAATTGKATPEQYDATNQKGTELLVAACEQAGVKNFLFMSTIAAKYQDKSHYAYARTKAAAEIAVKTSQLNYVILRPTIVIGPGGDAWRSLSRLGRAPILFVFGTGKTRVQPIYIEDLISRMLDILDRATFNNQVLEVGGPDIIPFEQFLRDIALVQQGKPPVTIHLPLRLLTAPLAVLERIAYSALPVNRGQLSVFANDSTAATGADQPHDGTMMGVQAMINLAIRQEEGHVEAHPRR